MSEYQYYEFLAVDKPLTHKEQEAVGEYSSRAEISSTRFCNEYNYGSFKGDEHKFLQKWFDVHVYVANWGTRRLMFRVPKDLIDLSLAKACCGGESVSIQSHGDLAIFDFLLQPDEGGGDWEEGSGWMATLAPLRDELLRGDLRVLYLGWLFCVQFGELEDDAVEPFTPPGLSKLSGAQNGLVDFLGIDQDLIAFAAQMSGSASPKSTGHELAAWVTALPTAEKDAMLISLCEGGDGMLGPRLRRRFDTARPKIATEGGHRTVRQMLEGAAKRSEERERIKADAAAMNRERERVEKVASRQKELDTLAAREEDSWREIEKWILMKTPKAYENAIAALKDLYDLATRSGGISDFSRRITSLRTNHAGKPSFMNRLRKAGL